jgi:GH25 family lysozyme M1 (1,4-beta-N-acetylmuramidase)
MNLVVYLIRVLEKDQQKEGAVANVSGIDVSRWQGEIDWVRVAAAGHHFAVIRATVGNHYTDPRFYENWRGARDAGLLVTAYHVVKPKNSAETQVARLFDVLEQRQPDLPLVLDVELADEQTPAVITGVIKECVQRIEQQTGRKPIIYTGAWFWDGNVLRAAEWASCDLWVANYGVETPGLPLDWTAWRFWQYSESGRVGGVSSRRTDLDWFSGSYDDLRAYANRSAEPVDTTNALLVARQLRARVTHPTLRVRSGPGVQYDHVSDLKAGDVLDILAVDGDDVWIAIEPGKWAAFTYRGETYMTLE